MRNTISGVSAEMEEKKRRSKNIIIHGLPEDKCSKEERVRKDRDTLDDIIRVTLGIETNKVLYDNVTRLGRDEKTGKRPLLATLPTSEIKEDLFSKLQKLRDSKYKDISIKHDMTPLERQAHNRIVERLKKLEEKPNYSGNYEFHIKGALHGGNT